VLAAILTIAGFSALFAVLPSQGAGKDVTLRGFLYRPSTIRIPTGGAVTFTNEDTVTHTATCQGCREDSGDIQPGMFKTVTYPSAGTFHLICRYHGDQGMVATLIVGPTASPSPTGTST
jgi:plastocyanin